MYSALDRLLLSLDLESPGLQIPALEQSYLGVEEDELFSSRGDEHIVRGDIDPLDDIRGIDVEDRDLPGFLEVQEEVAATAADDQVAELRIEWADQRLDPFTFQRVDRGQPIKPHDPIRTAPGDLEPIGGEATEDWLIVSPAHRTNLLATLDVPEP